jgi:hypothetical protein
MNTAPLIKKLQKLLTQAEKVILSDWGAATRQITMLLGEAAKLTPRLVRMHATLGGSGGGGGNDDDDAAADDDTFGVLAAFGNAKSLLMLRHSEQLEIIFAALVDDCERLRAAARTLRLLSDDAFTQHSTFAAREAADAANPAAAAAATAGGALSFVLEKKGGRLAAVRSHASPTKSTPSSSSSSASMAAADKAAADRTYVDDAVRWLEDLAVAFTAECTRRCVLLESPQLTLTPARATHNNDDDDDDDGGGGGGGGGGDDDDGARCVVDAGEVLAEWQRSLIDRRVVFDIFAAAKRGVPPPYVSAELRS